MLQNKIAIGEFQVKELLTNHLDSLVTIIVDSKVEAKKYNNKNIEINKSYFDKNIKNNDIHSVALFNPYPMEFNDKDILVININNLGEIGTIIRTAISFNVFNIALISDNIDVFNKTMIRTSEGAFFKSNIKTFKSILDIKKQYKNNLIVVDDSKYPSLDIAFTLYKNYLK